MGRKVVRGEVVLGLIKRSNGVTRGSVAEKKRGRPAHSRQDRIIENFKDDLQISGAKMHAERLGQERNPLYQLIVYQARKRQSRRLREDMKEGIDRLKEMGIDPTTEG